MLICPNCHAEYREGFTSCSDCDVPLVREQVNSSTALTLPPGPDSPGEDPYCSFWKGDDPRVHAEICSLLDEQSIPHRTIRREDHLFNISRQPALEIGIPFSRFDKAEAALREAYGEDQADATAETDSTPLLDDPVQKSKFLETTERRGVIVALLEKLNDLGGELARQRDIREKQGAWDPDDWFPEDATAQIWQGDDNTFQDIFISSLAENEIHARWDDLKGQYSLHVLPQDEERAKEIIRQIVEATPEE